MLPCPQDALGCSPRCTDAELLSLDTEPSSLDTEPLSLDTELLSLDTEPLSLDARLISPHTELLPLDAELLSRMQLASCKDQHKKCEEDSASLHSLHDVRSCSSSSSFGAPLACLEAERCCIPLPWKAVIQQCCTACSWLSFPEQWGGPWPSPRPVIHRERAARTPTIPSWGISPCACRADGGCHLGNPWYLLKQSQSQDK